VMARLPISVRDALYAGRDTSRLSNSRYEKKAEFQPTKRTLIP
jgi:hypothetical protein